MDATYVEPIAPPENSESQFKHDVITHARLNRSDNSRRYSITKRLIDIVVSALGLLLLFPVMVVIAVLIKLDSPGPVLFRQQRIGHNRRRKNRQNGQFLERRNGHNLKGQPIEIYKFRTMYHHVKAYDVSPCRRDDARLTSVGKILRRLCLDELPQFFNVLKGDISLVGPRPEMPFIVEQYGPLEELRLRVKPGVTGLWQLNGERDRFIHENIKYDLEYLANLSIALDCRILVKTLFFALKFRNV